MKNRGTVGPSAPPRQERPPAVPQVGRQFQSLSQQVYTAILHAIANRQIRPGERLRLDSLAADLGVSRTPIRDALSRLAAEGLVRGAGRTALCVTRLGAEDLTHLYELRLMCELFALSKGFATVTPALLAELESCLEEMVRYCQSADPDDRIPMSVADRTFHLLLVGLARNPRLTEFYARLNVHIHTIRVGPSPTPPQARARVNATEHTAIIRALRAKRLEAAREALSTHIHRGLARAIESIRLLEAEGEKPDPRPPRSNARKSQPAPARSDRPPAPSRRPRPRTPEDRP
ncbi:MAG: GntR family transcriptional regulator [Candidatus Methylomirabilota bacterium]